MEAMLFLPTFCILQVEAIAIGAVAHPAPAGAQCGARIDRPLKVHEGPSAAKHPLRIILPQVDVLADHTDFCAPIPSDVSHISRSI